MHPTAANKRKTKRETSKQGIWPTNKQDLINKHLKQFMSFTNSIEFDIL
jgi:hypothetical protein